MRSRRHKEEGGSRGKKGGSRERKGEYDMRNEKEE